MQLLRQMEVLLAYKYVDVMSAKISHHMIVDAIMRRDEKEAVHLVTEHLAEFYKIRDYFPFIVKEPIIE